MQTTARISNRMRRNRTLVAFFCLFPILGGAADAAVPADGLVRLEGSGLIRKVIAGSDHIVATKAPGGGGAAFTMEMLTPYYVIAVEGEHLKITDLPASTRAEAEKGNVGYIPARQIHDWPTREALKFTRLISQKDLERMPITGWDSLERLKAYANSGNAEFGPTFKEDQRRTATLPEELRPYPVLSSLQVPTSFCRPRVVQEVLLPAWVAPGGATVQVKTDQKQLANAMSSSTIVVVFDSTGSMESYARDAAKNIEGLVQQLKSDTSLVRVGFVFFRDEGDSVPLEIVKPLPIDQAFKVLAEQASKVSGGGDLAEPILDALAVTANKYPWDSGAAQKGARKVVLAVLNDDAKPATTGALDRAVETGLSVAQIAQRLIDEHITTFTFQVGENNGANLIPTLSKLASATGGEFYSASMNASTRSRAFGSTMARVIGSTTAATKEAGAKVAAAAIPEGKYVTLPLAAVDDPSLLDRLRRLGVEMNLDSKGGLLVSKAYLFENLDQAVPVIEVDKPMLQGLVRFFRTLSTMGIDTASLIQTARGDLEAVVGETINPSEPLDKVIARSTGVKFKSGLLSVPLDHIAGLTPEERSSYQKRISEASEQLATFLDGNLEEFDRKSLVWMPMNYLP